MHTLDVVVIVVYMALLVSVGVRLSRRQNTTDEYFLARRSVPGWALGSRDARALHGHARIIESAARDHALASDAGAALKGAFGEGPFPCFGPLRSH